MTKLKLNVQKSYITTTKTTLTYSFSLVKQKLQIMMLIMLYKDQTKYNFRMKFQQIQLLITDKQQQKKATC